MFEILTIMNTTIILIIVFLFLKNKKLFSITSGEETKSGFFKFDDTFSEYEKKLLTKIYDKFSKYSNSEVGLDFIFTTVWKESGGQIFNDVPNEKIIGDNGNSIGYFQIYKFGALLEVNQRENKNYSFEDLKDEQINVFFGIKYLSYCVQSALKQQRNKPVAWLVGKKYNGGLDETENSINAQAEKYANDYYSKYLKVKKFIELNFV